jgi:hypothetical protein
MNCQYQLPVQEYREIAILSASFLMHAAHMNILISDVYQNANAASS